MGFLILHIFIHERLNITGTHCHCRLSILKERLAKIELYYYIVTNKNAVGVFFLSLMSHKHRNSIERRARNSAGAEVLAVARRPGDRRASIEKIRQSPRAVSKGSSPRRVLEKRVCVCIFYSCNTQHRLKRFAWRHAVTLNLNKIKFLTEPHTGREMPHPID